METGNFRKTLRSATLKMRQLDAINFKRESLLVTDMFQDEDIKLFLEVHEEDQNYDLAKRLFSNDDIPVEYHTPQLSSVKRRKFDDMKTRSNDTVSNATSVTVSIAFQSKVRV